jgi:drug/metabolite transporter (DMT)-like permease
MAAMEKPSVLWSGVPMALASACLFGASTPFAKFLLGDGADPWLLAGLLYLGSGLGLATFLLLRPKSQAREAPLRWSDMPWLALVILFGGVAGPLLLMLGLMKTPAASASLLLNLEGVATLVIAWTVFRENVDRRLFLGAGAILIGAVLLSWTGGAAPVSWSALAVTGACLCWGIDNNLTRKISGSDPVQIAAAKGLVAGAVNLTLATAQGAALPNPIRIAEAGLLGLVGYGISLIFFVRALRHLGSARTGAYYAVAPFVGAILAIGMFGEPLTLRLVLAALLMAFGLYLHLTEDHAHAHAHQALDHEHVHTHDAHHRHNHDPGDPPGEPHSHPHHHDPLRHGHRHFPDLHHRHKHG